MGPQKLLPGYAYASLGSNLYFIGGRITELWKSCVSWVSNNYSTAGSTNVHNYIKNSFLPVKTKSILNLSVTKSPQKPNKYKTLYLH